MSAPYRQPCECGQFIDDLPDAVSHCFIHHEDEPVTDDCYRVCFECKHVYPTAQSLVDAYQREYQLLDHADVMWGGFSWLDRKLLAWRERRRVRRITADQIFFCQECLHDF